MARMQFNAPAVHLLPASPAHYTVANRPSSSIRLIVIHVTESSAASAETWFRNPKAQAAWTSHDSGHNGHDGGLQKSFDFMRGYGPEVYAAKGTADHWTPLEQMWVAVRAWQVRSFDPWPTTARLCGLLH